MRPSSQAIDSLLLDSFDISFRAALWYAGRPLVSDLAIDAPSLVWDASAEVEGSGTVTVVWSDEHGSSMTPLDAGDKLAPFGARLIVSAVIEAGGNAVGRIQLGDFDITGVPSVDGQPIVWGTTNIYAGSRIDLVLKDRMVEVQRDRFTHLASPGQLNSVWREMAALTGFQVTRSLPDAPITRSVVYEESRVSALQDVALIIGGIPFMEWDGTLSCRPVAPGAVVADLRMGERGTIAQVGSSLSADGVYNGVIIRHPDTGEILAELWITSGALRATPVGGERTPFHRVPRFYSSPFITTQAQAQAAAPGLLEQYSNPRATTLEVTCVINPLLQIGDVVTVADGTYLWTIRLTRVPVEQSAMMTVTGDVIDRVISG